MDQISRAENSIDINEEALEEEELDDDLIVFDSKYRINYSFEIDLKQQYLSFNPQIAGQNNLFPLYSLIELTIINDDDKDTNSPYNYSFPITLLSTEDNKNIQSLKTKIPISQIKRWPSLKISIKCYYFPNQKIPTGLNSKYSLCYLNSVIQMLYNIPKFRQIIYSLPTKDSNHMPHPILLKLQKLFSQMSINSYNVNNNGKSISKDFIPSAIELAKSFGWTNDDLLEEQDAHEFLTIFLDKLRTLLAPYPSLADQFNSLFDGQFMHDSKIEDFSSFSIPLSKGLEHSLNKCIHPNYSENYSKLYFALQKFISVLNEKESIPSEFQVLGDEIISILNENLNNDNKNNKNSSTKTTNNNDGSLNHKSVSFGFNNECNQLNDSIYKILKDDLNNNINQCCLKLAVSLKRMAKKDKNAQYPSKAAQILSERLYSIYNNTNSSTNNSDIAQLICDFYLDENIKKMSNVTNYFIKSPKILILQIRRFHDENGSITKSNEIFEFPEEFSMNNYLQHQNDNNNNVESEYELIDIISHCGELDKGHYVEFSRPLNHDSFWFKFDEKKVTLVSKKEAITDNFGDNSNIIRSYSLGTQNLPNLPIQRTSTGNVNENNKMTPKSLNINRCPPVYPPANKMMNKQSLIQSSNAYILVYVNKKYRKEIIDIDVPVPENLKIKKEEITAPLNIPESPKKDIIRFLKSDDVPKLIKDNHFFMKNAPIFDENTIKVDYKKCRLVTVGDLYQYVKSKIDGYFILWKCTNGFNPTNPLKDFNQKLKDEIASYFDTFIFIQQTGEINNIERNFNIFDFIFYVLFFDPFNPNHFQYLGIVDFNIDHCIDSIFDIIKDRLRKANIVKRHDFDSSNDDEIAVFYENENQSATYLHPSSSVKSIFNQKNSSNLIVQYVYNITDYNSLQVNNDYALCDSLEDESYTRLMMMNPDESNHSFNPLFVSYYYQMKYNSFNVRFHRIGTSEFVTLKIPKKAKMTEVSRVLYNAFYEIEEKRSKRSAFLKMQPFSKHYSEIVSRIQNGQYEDADISQLIVSEENVFAQFFYSGQKVLYPITMPVTTIPSSSIQKILPHFQQKMDLFFEFFPLKVFPDLKKYLTARVEISYDAIIYNKTHQVLIDNGETTYSDISKMIGIDTNLLQKNEATDIDNSDVYRILMILKGKIVKYVIDYNEKIRADDCKNYIFRFEKVPNNQKIGSNSVKVRVHYGIRSNNSEVKLFGVPFYFAFQRGENENQVFQRIKSEYMKFMEPDEKTEFVITNAQMKIVKGSGIESLTDFNNMDDDNNSLWCICILMNGRISIKEIITMERANSNNQLKIYT